MTDAALPPAGAASAVRTAAERRLRKRHAAERRFKAYGLAAIVIALTFLVILVGRLGMQGYHAFWTHSVTMPVYVDAARVDRTDLAGANYDMMIAEQLLARLGAENDELGENAMKAKDLISPDMGYQVLERLRADPSLIGRTVSVTAPVAGNADLYFKGELGRDIAEDDRRLDDQQFDWLDRLKADGLVRGHFNSGLFTRSDSTQPELAGLLGAIVGSALMVIVTALIAVPMGVGAAVYLEMFAPKNRWTGLIEVNINNLAAVPSIVYGLLGLAVFINWLGFPRSAPITGGVVLALMALPTIIIATRSALKAVPPSITDGALAVGASKTQAVFHHVLPLAMPGIMTGTIISLAHAIGETAPLLMIGMVSFVPGVPEGFTSAATVLPVEIFIWENASERSFHEKTAAAILVLLGFMIVMNAAAIVLRRRFERRW
ncbi:MAG TPA: phosphate ABC transporter permease PstA [Caulobacteraceae bacterium]|nr:phosphate ABC transporter permease PstA [Caulobacteraceae bacterium]